MLLVFQRPGCSRFSLQEGRSSRQAITSRSSANCAERQAGQFDREHRPKGNAARRRARSIGAVLATLAAAEYRLKPRWHSRSLRRMAALRVAHCDPPRRLQRRPEPTDCTRIASWRPTQPEAPCASTLSTLLFPFRFALIAAQHQEKHAYF